LRISKEYGRPSSDVSEVIRCVAIGDLERVAYSVVVIVLCDIA
ncbi:hypothetical protein T12_8194, partial [Trichinella patagoniensis]